MNRGGIVSRQCFSGMYRQMMRAGTWYIGNCEVSSVYSLYSIRDAFSLYSTCLELCLMCLIVQPNVVITGHLSQIWITLTYIQVFELSRAVVNDMGFVKYSVEHVQVWLFLSPCSVYYRDSYRKWVWLPDDVMDLEDSILTALSGHLNTLVPVL